MQETSSRDGASPTILSLLRELGDLKRVRSAGRDGSIATRLFRAAWRGVLEGADDGALATTAQALAAARLGDLDAAVLRPAGLADAEILQILWAAVRAVGSDLPASEVEALARACRLVPYAAAELPPFVAALEAQPRAGVTCPGKPRILLEPPENHAEHCLVVAVYGVLLAPSYGADPEAVYLAGLAHHFHNAGMPDAGFTGEMLLGEHLHAVMSHYTDACLAQLPPAVAARIRTARGILDDAATPEGRAFHAADVIDRVLQIEQHLRGARLTMGVMLDDMALVHEGPVKPFHDDVLRRVGLLP